MTQDLREEFTLTATNVNHGASLAPIADDRRVTVRIMDDGDVSAPGVPRRPVLVRSTGGLLELSLAGVDPANKGGASEVISARRILRVLGTGALEPATVTLTGLRALTTYEFVVIVSNSQFDSPPSKVFAAMTTRVTPPSSPRNVELSRRTGGMLLIEWEQPVDLGGVALSGYFVHVYQTSQGQVRPVGSGTCA